MFRQGANKIANLKDNFFHGHHYACNRVVGCKVYVECKRKLLDQCPARGNITNGVLILTKAHNHAPDVESEEIRQFETELFTAVTSSLKNFREIYDSISILNQRVAAHVPFVKVHKRMKNWRNRNRPPAPRNFLEYEALINSSTWHQKFAQFKNSELNVKTIRVRDGAFVTVYGDQQFLRQLNASEFYIDATFEVCPRQPKMRQFLTIMAKVEDAYLPITWAIMSSKSTAAYIAVLRHFSTVLAPQLQPAQFMVDFEKGLSTAISTIYPNAIILHCFFHFCKALMKRVIRKKGKSAYEFIRNWPEGKLFFRTLMALALLPQEDIQTGFDWLISNTCLEVVCYFSDLIAYFSRWWLNTVTPRKFTVYGHVNRTNNVIEAYHRILRERMGSHPKIWKFTEDLLHLQQTVSVEFSSLQLGYAIRRKVENKYLKQNEMIMRAWYLYQNQTMDIPRFLTCMSHVLKGFGRDFLIENVSQVDEFANMENYHDIVPLPNRFEQVDQVFTVQEIPLSRCPTCGVNLASFISLPCCHWFACEPCTLNLLTLAASLGGAEIRCSDCGSMSQLFRKILSG